VEEPPPAPDLPELPPLPELPAFVEKVTPSAPPPRRDIKLKKSASQATPQSSNATSTGTLALQSLTFGQGEGRQPAPPYPSEALSRHQEGTVMIQFLVGTEGQVLNAEVWQSSPWALLNEAALRTVRGRWQFSKGPVRLYRVPIRFRIQH
jgi:protein TonB